MISYAFLNSLINALGWTLLDFLWQGALVAACFAFVNVVLRAASASARYVAACAALALMAALPLVTLAIHLHGAANSAGSIARMTDKFDLEDATAHDKLRDTTTQLMYERAWNDKTEISFAPPAFLEPWSEERLAPWLPRAVALWAAGVLALFARFGGGWLSVRRLRCRTHMPLPHIWQEKFNWLASELRVARRVRLCASALVEVPTVIGWLRPVVLVPVRALSLLTPPQLRALLAHELAHVKRHDYLVNMLQSVIEILLFYHPAIWWVSRRARIEREHACDDLAITTTGDALTYARALTELEQLRHDHDAAHKLALAADGGSLMKRIQRIVCIHLRPSSQGRAASPLVASVVALLVCLSVAAGARSAWRTSIAESPAAPLARAVTTPAPQRQVAVTFVSFPANTLYDGERLTNKTRKLMRSLAANRIEAIGFVNEARLYKEDGTPDETRVALLREWLDANHELGNETFKHTNLFKVSLDEFKRDVLRGEQIMSRLMRERGRSGLRYFSYPYLNTGAGTEVKRAAEAFLAERGYRIHPVTIDNMDWLFNKAYTEALRENDEKRMERIRTEYVPYMERMFEFFEAYSREVVGREFPQVLMLTAGALNADTFDELALMMRRRGYSFITMEEATRDAAYSLPDTYTGVRGDSWIARWAVTKGMEYKDSEENLPPFMQAYFENFLAEQRAKNAGRR